MSTSTLNLYVIGGFLLLNLIIGIWAGRGVKDIRDYALANKSYSISIITITFLATYFDAFNIIYNQGDILKYGLVAALQPFFTSMLFIWLAFWVAPKLTKFKDCLTLGDVMENLYGKMGGQIATLLSGVYVIGMVCLQIVALGNVFEALSGWDSSMVIFIGGGVIVIYSSFGGVKAVTITDILQLLVFLILVPIIAHKALYSAGSLPSILVNLPHDKLQIFTHPKSNHYFFSTYLSWLLPYYFVSPPIFQRLLMVPSKGKVSKIFIISSSFIILVGIMITVLCLAVSSLNPAIDSSTIGGAFVYVIKNYCSPVMQSLCLVAMLAIMMSTIDSFLNSGGVLLTKNFVNPMLNKFKIACNDIIVIRIVTAFIGIFSVFIAMKKIDLETIFIWSGLLYFPVVTTALISGIMGLKTSFKNFVVSTIFTIPFAIFMRLTWTHGQGLRSVIIFLANLIVYFTAHIIQNKGIAMLDKKNEPIVQD